MGARIYAACLASYNNGVLYGRWIDVSDVETMEEEIAEMLRGSPFPNVMVTCPDCGGECGTGEQVAPGVAGVEFGCEACGGTGTVPSAEEYAVHDHEGVGDCGEYPSLASLCEYVDAIDSLNGEEEEEAFHAWRDNESRAGMDAAELVEQFREEYRGTFSTIAEYAESFADDTGMLSDVPDVIARYFDFESYGHDLVTGGDLWTHRGDHGLHVFENC